MSRFFSEKYASLVPYTPGEQPKDIKYIKLNTNESPFPPSERAVTEALAAAKRLQLYPDPTYSALHKAIADTIGVAPENVLATNGSDEILNFAFMAFCDAEHPAVFPDITYGFYPVFAKLSGVPYTEIPLNGDFTVNVEDYIGVGKTVFLANPNAPTGIALPLSDIERIVASNPDNVVVIDEAYVDFGAESAVTLVDKYDNLLVTQTFSKSRSMAGGRLGFGVGSAALIRDLSTVKYSTNPYNVSAMTAAAGIGTLLDAQYTERNCRKIAENWEYTKTELRKRGFLMTDSMANFLFVRHPAVGGEALYRALRERGILVRHFSLPRITDYNRITVGSAEEMRALIRCIDEILEECL